jgi:diguanylate cyclase (GGDEF)-like protein
MRQLPKGVKSPRKGLRYKLMLAFSLMSIIPLLACMYLITACIFPQVQNMVDASTIMLISIVISILGLGLAKGLVDPVVDMAVEARIIASGNYDRKISVSSDDELGFLGESINLMTQSIKSNITELKTIGQKTKEIDLEIHKKIVSLSNLLQLGDIIAKGSVELTVVIEMATQKVAAIFDRGYAILYLTRPKDGDFLARASSGVQNDKLLGLVLKEGGSNMLERLMRERATLVVDESMKKSKDSEEARGVYGVSNMVAVPLFSGRKTLGLLLVGNDHEDYRFKTDDVDLVKVFARQITIAVENEALLKKTEELAIIDELTGLFNKNYVLSRLEEEIKRAIFYQRPCSFMVFNIDDFKLFRESKGDLAAEDVLKKISKIVKENATPMGKAGRIGWDEFSILLPEKNKKEAASIAESLRKRIEGHNFTTEGKLNFTVSVGVSENPIDGSTKEELFKKAMEALANAKAQGKNRVSV